MTIEAVERPALLAGAVSLASVDAVNGPELRVSGRGFGFVAARLAVTGDYAPQRGDTVLVTEGDDGRRYVVGVVRALRVKDGTEPREVRAEGGARASVERDGEAEVLRVHDTEGRLLFEHRPAEGRSVLSAPAGTLELRADAGDLELAASGAVRVRSGEMVELEGRAVRLRAADGSSSSELRMRAERTELETERFGAAIERADVRVAEANLVARTLRTVAGRVKHKAEVLETQAERIVERAKEAWRETEGLSQTRAGRVRMVAEQTLHLLAERTTLKAREDVKVKGEKIYLG